MRLVETAEKSKGIENIKHYYVETTQFLIENNTNLVLYFKLKHIKSQNKTENSIGTAFSIIIIEKNLKTEEIKS